MAATPRQFGNSALFYRLLLLRLLQEQANAQAQGGAPGKPKQSTAQKIDEYISNAQKIRQAYGAASSLYNKAGGPSSAGTIPTGAAIPKAGSAGASGGFSSVEEMMGNGLYTPAQPQYQTPAAGASTAQTPSNSSTTDAGTTSTGTGVGWKDIAPYLNVGLSIYNAYKLLQNKNMGEGQRNLALAGTAAQASTPLTGGYGTTLAAGLNAGAALKGKGTEEEKTREATKQVGMAVANYYTAGLAGLADAYAQKQWGGTYRKLDNFMWNNPLGGMYGVTLATKPFDTDAWKKEGGRVKKLLDSGVDVPEMFRGRMYQQRGLDKKQLVDPNFASDFSGMTENGWVNNKFQNSRNESDMTYYDLAPYAAWAEKRADWWKLSDAQRKAITDRAQAVGAVREHHGTLDVDWGKVGDVDQLIASVPNEQAQQRQVRIPRPKPGQVVRLSPGMYRNSSGALQYNNEIPRAERKIK